MMRLSAIGLISSLGLSLPGCAAGSASSSSLPTEPSIAESGRVTCKVKKSQLRPLVVEWSSADRAELEARMHEGLVVVRYLGCEMQVLPRCRATRGSYRFVGVTRKTDRIAIRDEDQLWANMPIGAAGLEAALKRAGQLDVSMTIVGQYESSLTHLTEDDLDGSCDGATHVLASLTVGAFELATSARADVAAGARVLDTGAGAKSTSERETITATVRRRLPQSKSTIRGRRTAAVRWFGSKRCRSASVRFASHSVRVIRTGTELSACASRSSRA
jgi:hypothetical protein